MPLPLRTSARPTKTAATARMPTQLNGIERFNKKLDNVPGAMLLNCVCERYGVSFKKERDSVRLASVLAPDEIPAEIRRTIEEIGRY
jgi:hypothetical protein